MDSELKNWLLAFADSLEDDNKKKDARAIREYCDKLDVIGPYMAENPPPGIEGFNAYLFGGALAAMLTVE